MTMRLALLGCGKAAAYESVVHRMPGVEFVAAADRDLESAKSAAATLGAAVAARTIQELLTTNGGAVDAVVIHESGAAAAESALAAAEAGKHVLSPAAMAGSAEEARGVVDACGSAGIVLMAGTVMRYWPSNMAIRRSMAKLGDPGLLRIHAWHSYETTATELLMSQAIDAFDLATWIFSTPPTEIYVTGSTGYVQIHMGFADGGMALIDYASTLPEGGRYFSLSLIGSTGAAYSDDHHNRELLFAGGEPRAVETDQGEFGYTEQLREFVSAIDEKRTPSAKGEDGVAALEVADASVKSLAAGVPVHSKGGAYGT